MPGPRVAAIVQHFDSRLATLQALLDKAAAAKGDAAEALLGARLADDMLPLANQILFCCNQPMQFIDWATGTSTANALPESLAAAAALITTVRTRLAGFAAEDALLAREKLISLPGDMGLRLDGAAYVDDWLLPNFYFHLVTAYDILRRDGVAIGKADFMAHLMPRVRPMPKA